MKLNIIVALDKNNGFSKNGSIPWINESFAKEDLQHFKSITSYNTCLMGRKTYEDIAKFTKRINILPNRECIVLSKNKSYFIDQSIPIFGSIQEALEYIDLNKEIFVIGGYEAFKEALNWNLNKIYITKIDKDYNCDLFFPIEVLNEKYKLLNERVSKTHPFILYQTYIKK